VVAFPFAFHIAVQQPLKPLWSRLLLCDHEPSRPSTVLSLLPASGEFISEFHSPRVILSFFPHPWPYRLGWLYQELNLPPTSLSGSWGVLGPPTTSMWQPFERPQFMVRDCRLNMDWIPGLLSTCLHHSELQVTTVSLLISTIHRSPHHPLSIFQPAVSSRAVPWQQFLTEEDFLASCPHVILSQSIAQNSSQPTFQLTGFQNWRPFHSTLLVFPSQADFQVTTDNWTVSATSYLTRL
jgi:hypothetical protein